jgi:prepilin-type N-terminal cleavage/methylation domain-containing protein
MRSRGSHTNRGFTLIELSVVLVIVGLISGSILLGRELIRASELRSVITDVTTFKTAVHTFRSKYNCLPGDCAHATDFWPQVTAGCPNGAAVGKQTCDGNGNGYIEGDWSAASHVDWNGPTNENFRAWQQLSFAELITGVYSGITHGTTNPQTCVPGENVPASRIFNSGYNWNSRNGEWNPSISGPFEYYFYGQQTQYIEFGALRLGDDMEGDSLPPADAQQVDAKIDDGKPGQGFWTTFKPNSGYNTHCASSPDPKLAIYNATWQAPACSFIIGTEF